VKIFHSGRPLDYKEEKKYNYREQYWKAFSEVQLD
jgi:hypothetical protein